VTNRDGAMSAAHEPAESAAPQPLARTAQDPGRLTRPPVENAPCEPLESATTRYLTAEQVGELLQVSPRTVQRWALEDASMPALRLGRTVRFPWAELERWFARSTQGSRKGKTIAGK
jgi:excisionase family DNA binding protein